MLWFLLALGDLLPFLLPLEDAWLRIGELVWFGLLLNGKESGEIGKFILAMEMNFGGVMDLK